MADKQANFEDEVGSYSIQVVRDRFLHSNNQMDGLVTHDTGRESYENIWATRYTHS